MQFNEAGDRMEPFNLKTERTEGYFDETVRACVRCFSCGCC